jgi:ABC-type polysaccharide/polyol phosphate transport system ATPase subunit
MNDPSKGRANVSESGKGGSMLAISARNVSKMYPIYEKARHQLMDLFLPGGPRCKEFWALRDVNLEIARGTTVGIIGANGAGKSTLLKVLTGISQPTTGEVQVNGRVASLLELGAGFHHELSGYENIRLNCSVLGMTEAEIEARTPAIIEFSELGDFLDRPVKTYSSGMYVRLGFAVAASIDPDVLFVDEALSVGDEYFRGKCINRLNQIREAGKTVVFVSHEIAAVKTLCQSVVYLDSGQVVAQGTAIEVADEYLRRSHARGNKRMQAFTTQTSTYPRWGSGEVLVEDVELIGPGGLPTRSLEPGQPFGVRLHYKANGPCRNPVFGVGIYRADGTMVQVSNNQWRENPIEVHGMQAGETGTVEMSCDSLPLLTGSYYITTFLYDHSHAAPTPVDHREHALVFQILDAQRWQHGLVLMDSRWRIERRKQGGETETLTWPPASGRPGLDDAGP